jgi:hypothetical protein
MTAAATRINPGSLHANPAFSQVVRVPAGFDTIYVGGRHGVGPAGVVVGPRDPPAITVAVVAGLAAPGVLVEIEAVAAVPAPRRPGDSGAETGRLAGGGDPRPGPAGAAGNMEP